MEVEATTTDATRLLRDAYLQRGIFLVLGAGVSFKSGLPSWPALLHRLFSTCYSPPRPALFDELSRDGLSLPVLASLLEEHARNLGTSSPAGREVFTDLVRDALYEDFPWYPEGLYRDGAREFVQTTDQQNLTLRAVSALCTFRSRGDGLFHHNPRVKAVVTFNLDALLQSHSWAKYCVEPRRRRILRTVERPSANSRPDKISVYHVHGFMRFDHKVGEKSSEAPDQMVLTEQDYFDAFNDPTRIFNYTFLHLLREHTAVFVGLSMQDENLRRLLHYSKAERVRALQAEGVPDSQLRARALRHVALLTAKPDHEVMRAHELTLGALGVRVIWLRSFDDIPGHFAHIYSAGGAAWQSVYDPIGR
jgi:hypothetical protein